MDAAREQALVQAWVDGTDAAVREGGMREGTVPACRCGRLSWISPVSGRRLCVDCCVVLDRCLCTPIETYNALVELVQTRMLMNAREELTADAIQERINALHNQLVDYYFPGPSVSSQPFTRQMLLGLVQQIGGDWPGGPLGTDTVPNGDIDLMGDDDLDTVRARVDAWLQANRGEEIDGNGGRV